MAPGPLYCCVNGVHATFGPGVLGTFISGFIGWVVVGLGGMAAIFFIRFVFVAHHGPDGLYSFFACWVVMGGGSGGAFRDLHFGMVSAFVGVGVVRFAVIVNGGLTLPGPSGPWAVGPDSPHRLSPTCRAQSPVSGHSPTHQPSHATIKQHTGDRNWTANLPPVRMRQTGKLFPSLKIHLSSR